MRVRCDNQYKTGANGGNLLGQPMLFECMGICVLNPAHESEIRGNRVHLLFVKYCHVSRSSGLIKTILQGTVKGGRRQVRQRKRWEENIREWTGLQFGKFPEGSGGTGKSGENWLQNHLWRPNDPCG